MNIVYRVSLYTPFELCHHQNARAHERQRRHVELFPSEPQSFTPVDLVEQRSRGSRSRQLCDLGGLQLLPVLRGEQLLQQLGNDLEDDLVLGVELGELLGQRGAELAFPEQSSQSADGTGFSLQVSFLGFLSRCRFSIWNDNLF